MQCNIDVTSVWKHYGIGLDDYVPYVIFPNENVRDFIINQNLQYTYNAN